MMDEIKKVLLFGVGAVASTYERATEVVESLATIFFLMSTTFLRSL